MAPIQNRKSEKAILFPESITLEGTWFIDHEKGATQYPFRALEKLKVNIRDLLQRCLATTILTSVGLSNRPLQLVVFRSQNAGYIGCGFLLSQ